MKRDPEDKVMFVALHREGGYAPCGIITFNATNQVAGFAYISSYDGPPLDPIHLNYQKAGTRVFRVNRHTNRELLHRVFWDYLPGGWGMRVLEAEHPELKVMRNAQKMYWFGTRTVGALSFFVNYIDGERPIRGIEYLEEVRSRSIQLKLAQIESLNMARAMHGVASHGGGRPKASFEDETGRQWLVKFNVPGEDQYNFARVENSIHRLAVKCGIDAVRSKVVQTSPGNDTLFVERYDYTPTSRPLRISALSLLPEEIVLSRADGDYKMLFDLAQKIACDPEEMRRELLRRMLFNTCVNNSDDHLQNFEFLMDSKSGCMRLSPAYDIIQDPFASPHIMPVFGVSRPSLSDRMMEHIIKASGLNRDLVLETRDQIMREVSKWRDVYAQGKVSEQDMRKCAIAFEIGLRKEASYEASRKKPIEHKPRLKPLMPEPWQK